MEFVRQHEIAACIEVQMRLSWPRRLQLFADKTMTSE
jgi:hypothetical protein